MPRNEFLCTKKTYGNFELRLEAKLVGKGDNAGIQFRTRRIPNHHEVSGYQADMGMLGNDRCGVRCMMNRDVTRCWLNRLRKQAPRHTSQVNGMHFASAVKMLTSKFG